MRRTLTIAVFGILVLASTLLLVEITAPDVAAFQGPRMGAGHGGPGHRGPGPGGMLNPRMFQRLAERLGLSDEQLNQIEGFFEAHRATAEPIRDEIRDLRGQVRDLTEDGAFFANEPAVTELAYAIGQAEARVHVERERLRAEIYQVLTPEQREQLKEMKNRFGGRRGGPRAGEGS